MKDLIIVDHAGTKVTSWNNGLGYTLRQSLGCGDYLEGYVKGEDAVAMRARVDALEEADDGRFSSDIWFNEFVNEGLI